MCFHIPDRQTDGRTDGDINPGGLSSLRSSRLTHTRCAWAGGTFLRCLRIVPRAHSRSACVLQELGWKYTKTNTRFARTGGTFFPVVLLRQFLVLAGNRFWFYILTYAT